MFGHVVLVSSVDVVKLLRSVPSKRVFLKEGLRYLTGFKIHYCLELRLPPENV
jgi:hypothetical protein